MTNKTKSNRLINEKSPYLLQHAYNPVDWYTWGQEAFAAAKEQNKPIFLSIGYSTCHWCHVMEHESFEDVEIAEMMNEAFINIKVDREERPDIDAVYMQVCQMMTGTGGWPMTIIMTPDQKPFFAGTYFPKQSVMNRIGMMELLPKVALAWMEQQKNIELNAEDLIKKMESMDAHEGVIPLNKKTLERAFDGIDNLFDPKHAGFGIKPKFPVPHNLLYSLRHHRSTENETALKITKESLNRMANGGIYDHLGGGFARYSTDREWVVPHFEKMLYDQAMLTHAYLEAYLVTKDKNYKRIVEETLNYVSREMTSTDGGFYCAEDADSEGVEGKFYIWEYEEINTLLGDKAKYFFDLFNIKEEGNYEDAAGHMPENGNILHVTESLKVVAEKYEIEEVKLEHIISECKARLFEAREKRVRPGKDDKILMDWNGLMISAFAKAGFILKNSDYISTAEKAYKFITEELRTEKRMLHRYAKGEAAIDAMLDDYSFFTWAALELYTATFKHQYIKDAIEMSNALSTHFEDKEQGGFYNTSDFGEQLIHRKKELYDGAVPSGNSVALMNLVRLSKLTGNTEYDITAQRLIDFFSTKVDSYPSIYAFFECALDYIYNPAVEIVITSNDKPQYSEFVDSLRNIYMPNVVIIYKQNEAMDLYASYLKNMPINKDETTVYVCKNYACQMPVNTVDDMKNLLVMSEMQKD